MAEEISDIHAVATGDIVGSSDLPTDARRRLPDVLRSTYVTVQQQASSDLPYDLAITGGDSWQCYVDDPSVALARSLHFWTLLYARGLPSRMALAVDTVDFIVDENLSESDGPAFRQSGRILSNLKREWWFTCRLPERASDAHHLAAEVLNEMIDHLLHQWTEAQAQALAGMVGTIGTDREITQQEIAEQWNPEPVTRQTVNRHLKRAHWHRLERTLTRFDRLIRSLND